ncbi:hypothetical protein ACH4TV_03860 [Streptomyces sp. NPDC020898]|uniref:hypothetical protein n=1 Tax=Streptomyces sp. NPDC020898 TaxID=3365101 RepID=UPI00378A25FD
MGQQEMTGAHTDGGTAVTGAATEFEPDVMDMLVETLRRAVRQELSAVGTDTLQGSAPLVVLSATRRITPPRRAWQLVGVACAAVGVLTLGQRLGTSISERPTA